ncbi:MULTISPECIES: ABC transporter ATP-binding protein [Terrisporobacter]|uniref:Thiamine ABC transporter permease n=2 Tax=Terrisporobacter TaxID=1505652 RepID=A0A0B3WNC6_9FIRM|nr:MULTISPECIES: ABC transporter ATP-binding protein [Terrisporobacter]KHS56050.1 thiamine ABC transporter permease [Terrisporobacter othiniensis]MCC3668097.1 ABC transporter ATP-binding protein/permease [Terrisporobacter mayombei]MCR1822848.1 ABC transporter ATP-binding protein/permease [Terrisporobacter muris]MDY3375179.1 ABC transporter ATP-binding protein [Terrisporobacter othiniensis]
MIKKFIKYYKPYKKLFFMDLLAALLFAVCNLVYPMITREIMNEVVPNKDLRMLVIFAFTLLFIFIMKAFLNHFMQYWGHVVGVRMQADMRSEVFTHLQKLPNSYFDNHKTGVTMSRIINDLMDISELAHHGPEDLFISIVMFVGSFLILLNVNIPLTLIIFAILPFVVIFAARQKRRMQKAFMETRVTTGEVNATLENSIAGMKVTKSFCNEKEELNKFNESNNVFKKARQAAYKVMADYFSGMNLFMDLLELIALVAGGYFTYLGEINLGDFAAYILYVKMFIEPIKKLINFTEQYQNGMTGFERFMEIINEDVEKEVENPVELKNIKGDIEINNVSFTYEDKKQVLKNLDLSIEAGKTVALVGPSGGGKTTLCNLIPRFYDFEEGDIRIDGKSIKNVSLKSLRKNIGVVGQDVFLFTGTIKENILCAKPNASNEEIIAAAKKARIHDFIMSLPEAYDTYIGERGVKLSGGQKQRISICRVFLKNPPIIILDEATSALDNVTEREIQKSLEELSKDRTNLVVAHRLSTIKNADEIIVLTDRGIAERGTHEELISNGGIYSKLHVS